MPTDQRWVRKSSAVEKAMYADKLQSVKPLFPDILAAIPVLLFQGAVGWTSHLLAP